MKLSVDVALTLPFVKKTDKVVVIGSSSIAGESGESYKLLAGSVARVDLYDPGEIGNVEEVIEGTLFSHHKQEWPVKDKVVADVVFTDAYANEAAIVFDVEARVYSFKEVGHNLEKVIRKKYPAAHRYVQLSQTGERRWVSHRRTAGVYGRRYGTCAACRELDYRGRDYQMTMFQYDVWVNQHTFGAGDCSIAQHARNPLQKYANTITWRTYPTPVAIELVKPDPNEVLMVTQIDDPPRVRLSIHSFEHYGKYYRYREREATAEDPEIRPVGQRPPANFEITTKSILLIPLADEYKYESAPKAAIYQILVVDTFVYMLAHEIGPPSDPTREKGGVMEYVYGPVVSRHPIGPWHVYRAGAKVASGRSGFLLSMRLLQTRKERKYLDLGSGFLAGIIQDHEADQVREMKRLELERAREVRAAENALQHHRGRGRGRGGRWTGRVK